MTEVTEADSLLINSDIKNEDNNYRDTRLNSLGFFSVIFLTVNATLGVGLLNMPYSFNNSGGISVAIGLQSIHVALVVCSLIIISFCAKISRADSLQNLVKYFCGASWSNFCSCSIFLYSYGACITYLIVIGDQFDKIFEFYYGPNYYELWYMNRDFLVMTVSIIAILPLCVSKDISFLKFASFIGFLSTFYITVMVMIEYIKLKPENIDIKTQPNHWTEIFKILPVLTFSFQCQTSWVPTYVEIRNASNFRVFGMIFCSMFICFFSYSWISIFGLSTFGSTFVQKDMMQNYDPRDPFVFVGIVLLIVKTIVVYPVLLYCGRIIIEQFFPQENNRNSSRRSIRIVSATIWVITSASLAIFVPNIGVAINYLGSLANLFVFILPGLCLYLILFQEQEYNMIKQEYKCFANKYLILVISTFFVSYGIGVFSYSLFISILDLW